MFNILKTGLYATSSLTGIFFFFGLIINQLQKENVRMIYQLFGKSGYWLTGFIGTTVHEFGHYIMCLVFNHTVTEVAWFRPLSGMEDGVLGYVSHSYDKGSLYQQIGNFFIGIAPMIIGTLVIIFLFRCLMPNAYKAFMKAKEPSYLSLYRKPSKRSILKVKTKALFKELFSSRNFKSIRFWIFLFSTLSITSHMSLSVQDIKGASSGLLIIYVFLTIIMFLFKGSLFSSKEVSKMVSNYNIFLLTFLSIGVISSLVFMIALKCLTFLFFF